MFTSSRNRASSILLENTETDISSLSATQIRLDHALETFSEEAANPQNILAMAVGGAVFKSVRCGALTLLGESRFAGLLSYGSALAAETSGFRAAHATFDRLSGRIPAQGIFEGKAWFTTFTDLGTLKLFGKLGEGRNPLLTHTMQASGMVAGRNLNARLGLIEQPTGSLAEQFVSAEIANMQMLAGYSLFGIATGHRMQMWEQSLELQRRSSVQATSPIFHFGEMESPQILAMSTERRGFFRRVGDTVKELSSVPAAVAPLVRVVLADISKQLENGNGENAHLKLLALKLLFHNATFVTEELQYEIDRLEQKTGAAIKSTLPRPPTNAEAATLAESTHALLRDPRTFIHGTSATAHSILGLLEYYRVELERFTEKAHMDRLTGLFNRNYLDETIPNLERNLSELAAKIIAHHVDLESKKIEDTEGLNLEEHFEERRVALINQYITDPSIRDWVLMVDIDHFKKVNDTYGHANGDIGLRHVADIIHGSIRSIRAGGGDIAFRYGGEEMFIYMRDTDEAGVKVVGERIQERLQTNPVIYLDSEGTPTATKKLTVTIGAARILPHIDVLGKVSFVGSITKAQHAADHALYEGKHGGRNRLVIAVAKP